MNNSMALRQNMLDCQLRPHQVTDPMLLEAFLKIPREAFLPEAQHSLAYSDATIMLETGTCLMEPRLAGKFLQNANLLSSDSVLMVGGGLYLAAIAAHLVSVVFIMEKEEETTLHHDALINELGIPNIAIVASEFEKGWPKENPYDVILFNGAIIRLPDIYAEALNEDGRMIAVMRQAEDPIGQAYLWTKKRGILSRRVLFDANLPLLLESSPQENFVF